ncbi:S-adenosyl-L-methionine-dependent methyltransferase [Piromyces finnis]|uniref:S-adenosyl-L-methionine-dependent methyltransferase n=1 Tax=Piromyces finnis TaxID=1754191 RepID=A0A1Y1VFG1_9FUNG|nr:S-adenosyl-L-methionine-dependent methyltransferase [Piromyces finnis]|eukprot:ORX54182.1 S-adenosyl-L-methionine-dependent methyltransferase [Piromyces finnis]
MEYFKPIKFREEVEQHFKKYFTESHYENICKALATPPLTTYFRQAKSNNCENNETADIADIDSFKEDIQQFIDKQYEEKQWKKMKIQKCPFDKLSNQVLCFPVENIDKDTFESYKRYEKKVIIDVSCGKSVLRGSDIYAPGLLAMSQNVEMYDYVSIYIDIDSKVLRGSCEPYETNLIYVGNGQILVNRNDIFSKTPQELQGMGVKMIDTIYRSPSFGSDKTIDDRVFLQNLPSLLCSEILNPKQNQLILDMCSAPGGKTMHIANITKNKAKIIAFDKSFPKIVSLNKILKKHDFTSIKAYNVDATKLASQLTKEDCLSLKKPELIMEMLNITNNQFSYDTVMQYLPTDKNKIPINQIKKSTIKNIIDDDDYMILNKKINHLQNVRCSIFPDESFDAILLDPPCSALGQRPMFLCDMTIENLLTFHSYQRPLIKVAHRLLKPGGRMVFSTCTFNPKENEEQVAWILENFKDMKLENLRERSSFAKEKIIIKNINFKNIDDIDEQKSIAVSPSIVQKINQYTLRFDPGDSICFKDDTIGFFISSFIKKDISCKNINKKVRIK